MLLSNKLLGQRYVKERLRSSLRKFYGRYGDYLTIWGPTLPNVTRHSGWWPPWVTPSIDQALHQYFTLLLIWTLLPNLTFYLIARGFNRTFATDVAYQQRTLTPPETWSLQVFLCWDQSLLNLSNLRTFEFRTSLGTSVFALHLMYATAIFSLILYLYIYAPITPYECHDRILKKKLITS